MLSWGTDSLASMPIRGKSGPRDWLRDWSQLVSPGAPWIQKEAGWDPWSWNTIRGLAPTGATGAGGEPRAACSCARVGCAKNKLAGSDRPHSRSRDRRKSACTKESTPTVLRSVSSVSNAGSRPRVWLRSDRRVAMAVGAGVAKPAGVTRPADTAVETAAETTSETTSETASETASAPVAATALGDRGIQWRVWLKG